jgi:beta-lysine 5,6-aminomutase beta subunit
MTQIRPYGDTHDDGAVQLSFTLPVADSSRAREAARQLILKLGFFACDIVHAEPLDGNFTMFIAYARTEMSIDPDEVVVEESSVDEPMTFDEINEYIEREIGRKVVVVGACTGFDAHTVGIDAIMNMKGYNHHFGLERYPMIEAYNMGAQVSNEALIERAVAVGADAILVSQVVTQKDSHVKNLTRLVELLEAEGLRGRFILIVGGPRIGQKLARELGFDAGFGKGTYAEHVAAFIARNI